MSIGQGNEVYVRLYVTITKRTADVLSSLIGLQCEGSWSMGDKRGKTEIVERCNNVMALERDRLETKKRLGRHSLTYRESGRTMRSTSVRNY